MSTANGDLYIPSPEVKALAARYWPVKAKPHGAALPQYQADMVHMQMALLTHYYPSMDDATAYRASQTSEYLDGLLRAPRRIPPYRPIPLEIRLG